MPDTAPPDATHERPRIGDGRIGSFICASVGLMSVAAVLCLRFPALLTTPELRVHYDVELLRLVLASAMVVAAGLGVLSIALGGPRLRAAIGLSALCLAMLLGGSYVATPDFTQPRLYLGLDWLVLDLFLTGAAFPTEAMPPWVAAFAMLSPATHGVPLFVGLNQMAASLPEVIEPLVRLALLALLYIALTLVRIALHRRRPQPAG